MRISAQLPPHLARTMGVAVPLALLNLSVAISYGALAAGPLGATALPTAIFSSLVAAVLGGAIVALASGGPAQVSGPTASLAVIYAALCVDLLARAGPGASILHVMPALALTVFASGMLLWLAGWLHLADAIKFMPTPVGAGFVTGVGLLVIWSQFPALVGIAGRLSAHSAYELVAVAKPGALVVGMGTAAVFWLYRRLTDRGHPALPAIAAGAALHHAIAAAGGAQLMGGTLGVIEPLTLGGPTLRAVWLSNVPDVATMLHALPYVAFIALEAIMTSAVAGVSVAQLTGAPSDANRIVRAQGIANMACGCLGGLPLTTISSMSLTAARSGASAPRTVAFAAVLLGGAALLASGLSAYVPLAALAGVLVMTGYGLIDRWARDLTQRVLRGAKDADIAGNLAVVLLVAAMFFVGGVPLALFVGAILAMLLLAVDLSRATTLGSYDAGLVASTRVWPAEKSAWLATARSSIAVYRPRGALFFGTADDLGRQLTQLRDGVHYCVIDLSKLTTLDATGCQIVAASARRLTGRGVTTLLAGVDPAKPRERAFIALGLTDPDPRASWHPDLDHALEWVEAQLLAQRWPEGASDSGAALAESPLARGISATELAAVLAMLQPRDVPEGPLFQRGDPASSLFLVDRGLVEICIPAPPGGRPTRLAAFGPGSIFGEISLLSTGQRTADAVCRVPSRLYEFSREAMNELQRCAPELHARIVINLGVHLANRLVIATSTVQAQQ